MRKWSKLQKALYNIVAPDIKFQIHCSVFKTHSLRCGSGKSKMREMSPRYWITIDKNIVWDFPEQFLECEAIAKTDIIMKGSGRKPFSIKDTYFWSENYTWVAETIRAYIDTPKNQLLTAEFEKDKYGFVDVLRAVDRRIGNEKRKPYVDKLKGGVTNE